MVVTASVSMLVVVTVDLCTGGEVHCFGGESSPVGQGNSLRPAIHRKGKHEEKEIHLVIKLIARCC